MKSKDKFSHYFIAKEHDEKDYFDFNYNYKDKSFKFVSCDDVFSKKSIDYGSQVLIDTILKNKDLYQGKILDIACGYGAISVVLSRFLDARFDMCDINSLAVNLAKINAKNNETSTNKIFESDMWENVEDKYNIVVSNPPIKTGKKVLMRFLDGILEHLEDNGKVIIVIKKNLGADSTRKYLKDIFGNCEVLNRDKGYYILQSIK